MFIYNIMSTNILPGSLTVTGNISTATAGIGGNLVVGGNITVTGNLYSANVTVSGGGGAGGVSSITTASGITSSGSTGALTISAVVANVVGVSGIGANNVRGTVAVSISGALSNSSTTSNSIGGVTLSGGIIFNSSSSTNSIGGVNLNNSNVEGSSFILYTSGSNGRLNVTNGPVGASYATGPKGLIEMEGSGRVNIGQYNAGQTGSETVNIFAGNSSRMTIGANNVIDMLGSRISNSSTTSNNIGGVTLSAGIISNSSTTSNSIGGVTLSGGIISNASTTSNSIGGVTLSGGIISNITQIQDAGGSYIDICTGNSLSRLGNFRFDSTDVNGTTGKIYPGLTGYIQITGNSAGTGGIVVSNAGIFLAPNVGSLPLHRYLVLGSAFNFVAGDAYYLFTYNFQYTGINDDTRVYLPSSLKNKISRMNLAPYTAVKLFDGVNPGCNYIFSNNTSNPTSFLINDVCAGMVNKDSEYIAYFI